MSAAGRMWRNLWRAPSRAPEPVPDAAAAEELAGRLQAAGIARLGRGLALHVLDAGNCGGCLAELRMLDSLAYGMSRHGLRFVASPRQADVLLVAGPVLRNLRTALLAGWEAAPDPRIVVAIGDCAIDGGVFKGSHAVSGGVDAVLPVDLVVHGCPPAPDEVMAALLLLLEADARRG